MGDWLYGLALCYMAVGITSFFIVTAELLWTSDEPHWGRITRMACLIALCCVVWPVPLIIFLRFSGLGR